MNKSQDKEKYKYFKKQKINETLPEFCQEENHHSNKLEYFCKNHNMLCCVACISKIRSKGNGQHSECKIYNVEDILPKKIKRFKENINNLEMLLKRHQQLLKEIEINFREFNNKKDLKQKIKNIFKRIRDKIDEREENLLIEVDFLFDDLLFNEKAKINNIYEIIKSTLKKSEIIAYELNNNNKNYITLINNCINFENTIIQIDKDLNKMDNNANINEYIFQEFYPEENHLLNNYLEKIEKFGFIYSNNFQFKECPNDIEVKDGNIIKKISKEGWVGVKYQNKLSKSKEEYIWIIKILKSFNKSIMVGVAPIDFDNKSPTFNYGWYYYCYSSSFYSGPPHNYINKKTNLKKPKKEIKLIMNMKKRSLKFIIDNENNDNGEFTNIPIDKYLVPVVFLYHTNDSIELINVDDYY